MPMRGVSADVGGRLLLVFVVGFGRRVCRAGIQRLVETRWRHISLAARRFLSARRRLFFVFADHNPVFAADQKCH